MKKIRLTRTMVAEYTPDPSCYPKGSTIEKMAEIDINLDDREPLFEECISDDVKYEIITEFLPDPQGLVYDVMSAPEAAEVWGVGETTVRNNAAAGKFESTEARRSGKSWLVTRQGMQRVFGNPKVKKGKEVE